jgi:hypothetical protein
LYQSKLTPTRSKVSSNVAAVALESSFIISIRVDVRQDCSINHKRSGLAPIAAQMQKGTFLSGLLHIRGAISSE